jgi:hypothetical protein
MRTAILSAFLRACLKFRERKGPFHRKIFGLFVDFIVHDEHGGTAPATCMTCAFALHVMHVHPAALHLLPA